MKDDTYLSKKDGTFRIEDVKSIPLDIADCRLDDGKKVLVDLSPALREAGVKVGERFRLGGTLTITRLEAIDNEDI